MKTQLLLVLAGLYAMVFAAQTLPQSVCPTTRVGKTIIHQCR